MIIEWAKSFFVRNLSNERYCLKWLHLHKTEETEELQPKIRVNYICWTVLVSDLPPCSSFSFSRILHQLAQSVTNIFEYSNIRIYWSRIYIRTFVRINFSFTNIFGHSFVSNLFVRIYSDIRW